MDFFRKAKEAAQEAAANVSASVNDHLDERRRKKEAGWRQQVIVVHQVPGAEYPRPEFKPFQEWADEFEPSGESATGGEPGMLQQGVQHVKEKARAAMLSQIERLVTDNVMKTALEGTSKLFTPIEGQASPFS